MDLVRGVPAGPAYAAELAGKDHPAEMAPGERAVAWIEFRNTGSATWSLTDTRVGTTGPRDHDGALYDAENWLSRNRATGADHSDYGPGATGRFSFMITAPEVTTDTTVTESFGLVQEGVTWFGPEDVTFSIVVHPRARAAMDGDGDGSASDADCDDADPARAPGAAETCGDGIDQDCDGTDATCAEIPAVDAGTGSTPPARDAGTGPPPAPDGGAPHARESGLHGMSGGCAAGGTGACEPGWLLALALGGAIGRASRRSRRRS
jgi:hypothetical protein